VENKLASLVVVSLGKTHNRMPLPFEWLDS